MIKIVKKDAHSYSITEVQFCGHFNIFSEQLARLHVGKTVYCKTCRNM